MSVAEVTRAYGAPQKREAYNEYKTKIEIVHLTYPGAEFLFKGDKLFQINISAGGGATANIGPVEPVKETSVGGAGMADNKDGEALFEAVRLGDETAVRDLIKRGSRLNFERKDETPLILAIRDKKTGIAKMLLEAGADPNFAESTYGGTPVRWAVQMGNIEIVEMLLNQYTADVNVRTKNGATVLHTAAEFNREERITAMLLAVGANPNVINEEGWSPLDLALMRRKPDIAQLLERVTNPREIIRLKKEYAARPKP
jgi:ankyrin repeat protein